MTFDKLCCFMYFVCVDSKIKINVQFVRVKWGLLAMDKLSQLEFFLDKKYLQFLIYIK